MDLRNGSLILRPWREADVAAVYEACQDPEIQRWIPVIPRPYTKQDAAAFVSAAVGLGTYRFAVEKEGQLVGSISMRVNEEAHTGRVGYWCARRARSRGITTEALRLLCRYAFEELAIERLELIADPENFASQRVAERTGFQREGILRAHLPHPDGRRRDSVMFSLLPGELVTSTRS
jgi:RimJ/RimL family protein N-acetyltransferase